MRPSSFFLFILVEQTLAQSLLSILQSTPGTLSTLNSLINSSTQLRTGFAAANNFTFLAPSNDAFKKWLASLGSTPSQDVVDATLTYHLISGGFPTVMFSSNPQFVSSVLKTPAFANITTGQTIELVESGGKFVFLTGSNTVSTITSGDIVCTGGLIHVIDTVLDIPQDLVSVITQSNLTFFVGILNQGGYLNAADRPLLLPILDYPDITFFAPNTATALAEFSSITKGVSKAELGEMFKYHAIPNFLGYSSALKHGMVWKTVQGSNVTITVQGNDTYINEAKIVRTDFLTANGVMHTIDSFLDRNNATNPSPPCQQPAETHSPSPSSTHTENREDTPTKPLKIGIAIASVSGVLILVALTTLYIRHYKRKLLATYNKNNNKPTKISGPYTQELGGIGAGNNYHGYREDELVDSGVRNGNGRGFVIERAEIEGKRVEFEAFTAELDGRERSRSRGRSRGRVDVRGKVEGVPKQFF